MGNGISAVVMFPLPARLADPLTLLPTVNVVVIERKTFLLSMKALTSVYNVCVNLLHIRHEDRIAQLICERIVYPDVCGVERLDGTVHGSGGFGSSRSKFLNCDVLNVKRLIRMYIVLLINYI
jgi:hypothetical protein